MDALCAAHQAARASPAHGVGRWAKGTCEIPEGGVRSTPLACIFGISRLYFTCIPPVSHRILDVPLYPCIDRYLAIMQQIHCIPLYPTVSSWRIPRGGECGPRGPASYRSRRWANPLNTIEYPWNTLEYLGIRGVPRIPRKKCRIPSHNLENK